MAGRDRERPREGAPDGDREVSNDEVVHLSAIDWPVTRVEENLQG
ncbi:MAG: hypothetical protein V3U43_07140 [Pseudomonadales bacterium]